MIKAQILITALVFYLLQGCARRGSQDSPPGYDFAKPVIYTMPSVLDEISGISFLNGNADKIYTEQDEEGKLFWFHPGNKEVRHTKFARHGDYEDVAICNGYAIILRSDGALFCFPLNTVNEKEVEAASAQEGLLPEGEYESLYADEANNDLYTVCKNCSSGRYTEGISGFILHIDNGGKFTTKSSFVVDTKHLPGIGEKNFRFKPSALAQNNKTKQWYILSSVNKMLLVTDDQWKPLHAYLLNPVLFTQPEGIAFDREHNLYISNEMGNGQHATILKFILNNN